MRIPHGGGLKAIAAALRRRNGEDDQMKMYVLMNVASCVMASAETNQDYAALPVNDKLLVLKIVTGALEQQIQVGAVMESLKLVFQNVKDCKPDKS